MMNLRRFSLNQEERNIFGPDIVQTMDDLPEDLPDSYKQLLGKTNGGYTEDKYFHFFGLIGPLQHNVIEWNNLDLWNEYFEFSSNWFVFAEDIFGDQYFFKRGSRKNAIYFLSSCSGQIYFAADSYKDFIEDVVDDREETMSEKIFLAKSFYKKYGFQYKYFQCLSYIVPPILNGKENDSDNLELCDSLLHIDFMGQLTSQLKNMKPGTVIREVIISKDKKHVQLIFSSD